MTMRRRPLWFALYLVPVLFLVLKTPVRDALEVAVQASVARVRLAFGRTRPLGRPPSPPPMVTGFLKHEHALSGRGACARIVQLVTAGDRFHVVVDRGEEDGVRIGDLAVFRTLPGGPLCLAGEIDAVSPAFARIRTLADSESWWLARAPSGRLILERGHREDGLRIVDPEHPRSLRDDVRDAQLVRTEAERSQGRTVPADLIIGPLEDRSEAHSTDWRVVPLFDPRRVLGLRLLSGGQTVLAERDRRGDEAGAGAWWPARVTRVLDANPLRSSMLVSRLGKAYAIPEDAPVARGAFLEGWVHTVAGGAARVRLVGDPGFYTHVLVLRPERGRLVAAGGGVFRGVRHAGYRLSGRVSKTREPVRPGDWLVVGPHKGTGGIGLLVGEVISWEAGGFVELRRLPRPHRGAAVWIGRFPRPPESFAVSRDDSR
jgi:cell shape-determining protein MreC